MTRPMFVLFFLFFLACPNAIPQPQEENGLFPLSENYTKGYLEVDEIHKIFYDQRGAGQSTPHGELRGNTTPNLVEDIERLRKHLDLGKIIVSGGSWGSTLGLAYAEKHPENVRGMILRGVFLGTEIEIEYHYLYELIRGDDKKLGNKVLDALHRYEIKFMKLNMPDELISSILGSFPKEIGYRMTCIDLHYVTNRYFMEEGQLLNNIGAIKEITAELIKAAAEFESL